VRFVVCPKKEKINLYLKFYADSIQTKDKLIKSSWRVFLGGMAVADGVLSTVKNPQIWRSRFNHFQPRSLDRRSPRGREKLGRPPP